MFPFASESMYGGPTTRARSALNAKRPRVEECENVDPERELHGLRHAFGSLTNARGQDATFVSKQGTGATAKAQGTGLAFANAAPPQADRDACSRRDGQAEALCNALPKTPTAIQKDAARTLTCDEVCVNDREDRWENIDVDPANPVLVGRYANNIFRNLQASEETKRPNAHYLAMQTEMTAQMRAILVDWLVEVAEEYRLNSETLYLAVNYIDRFLSRVFVSKSQLQLVGITCMLVASKYEEIYAPQAGGVAVNETGGGGGGGGGALGPGREPMRRDPARRLSTSPTPRSAGGRVLLHHGQHVHARGHAPDGVAGARHAAVRVNRRHQQGLPPALPPGRPRRLDARVPGGLPVRAGACGLRDAALPGEQGRGVRRAAVPLHAPAAPLDAHAGPLHPVPRLPARRLRPEALGPLPQRAPPLGAARGAGQVLGPSLQVCVQAHAPARAARAHLQRLSCNWRTPLHPRRRPPTGGAAGQSPRACRPSVTRGPHTPLAFSSLLRGTARLPPVLVPPCRSPCAALGGRVRAPRTRGPFRFS